MTFFIVLSENHAKLPPYARFSKESWPFHPWLRKHLLDQTAALSIDFHEEVPSGGSFRRFPGTAVVLML